MLNQIKPTTGKLLQQMLMETAPALEYTPL